MTPDQQKKFDTLQRKLRELFMLDFPELDFGIYRIMNHKRREIEQFLAQDLLPQVRSILAENQSADVASIRRELENLEKTLHSAGVDPNANNKVLELRRTLAHDDPDALAPEIYFHLTTFFSRYYDSGDFISQRRYKNDVYAIPYQGEEVKLHWANHDQYYIKTAEHFKTYRFRLDEQRLVTFTLAEVTTDQNNNKSSDKRAFALADADFLNAANPDDLTLTFTYLPTKTKQADLNRDAFERIKTALADPALHAWLDLVQPGKGATPTNTQRSLLEKHLTDYTARNTFDYFIHKDLGAFLHRELDFYIKNEILFLDDIGTRAADEFVRQIGKIKAIKAVGEKIIAFLAQLENFQKKLWLKKKFVTDTHYCITLDRIPADFYAEIAANTEQTEEWVRLFRIDLIEGGPAKDLLSQPVTGFSRPLSVSFLEENPFLPVDTAFFSEDFKARLLAQFHDLDEQVDGLLIHSENFQALGLLQERYREEVKCVYIDPPYNTGNDDFLYKDEYQHSSWLSMLHERVLLSKELLKKEGTFTTSIDLKELDKTISLLDSAFGESSRKNCVTVKRGSVTGAKVINPGVVNISEFVLIYSNVSNYWKPGKAYREKAYDDRYGTYITNIDEGYEKWQFMTVLEAFALHNNLPKPKLKKHLGERYDDLLFEFIIQNASKVVRTASLDESQISEEALKLKKFSLEKPDKIFYLSRTDSNDYFIINGNLILFYKDRLIQVGDRLVPGEPISDIWDDVLPNDLHNEGGVQLRKGKKPEKLIHRVIEVGSLPGDLVIDYFVGSGTTGAVCLKSRRKFIGIEQGDYFDSSTLKRIKNTLAGEKSGVTRATGWKGGGIVKYIRLESYEDTLNNLLPSAPDAGLWQDAPAAREEYLLHYLLDFETRDQHLDLARFRKPFDYRLRITRSQETREQGIDLVETFNYLIGLRVAHRWQPRSGLCLLRGLTRAGDCTLVIWRDCDSWDNAALNAFLEKSDINPRDGEFDRIYVNGDNNVENLKTGDERWKVVLTEEEFLRRMFENT